MLKMEEFIEHYKHYTAVVWSSAFRQNTNSVLLLYCQCCAHSVIEGFIAAIIYKNINIVIVHNNNRVQFVVI